MLPTVLQPAPELVLFVILVAATPGPLNLTLLSIGLGGRRRFGFGVLAGAAVTYGALYALASSTARRIAAMDQTVFQLLQLGAVALLLWIAWRIATAKPVSPQGQQAAHPGAAGLGAGIASGMVICGMGAKSWSTAISAGLIYCDGALNPTQHAIQFGTLAVAIMFSLCGMWLMAGIGLGRRLTSPRALRAVNIASGGILAGIAMTVAVQ